MHEDKHIYLTHLGLHAQVSDANLAQMPGYRQRLEVLRRLQYVGPDDSVEVKVRRPAGRGMAGLSWYPREGLEQSCFWGRAAPMRGVSCGCRACLVACSRHPSTNLT